MKINIISVQTDDRLDDFVKVIQQAFSSTSDADLSEWYSFYEVRQSLENRKGIILKAVNNKDLVVGVVHVQPENTIFGQEGKNKWQITNIAVLPKYQRQGIGGDLLKAVEKIVQQKQANKILIHTNPDDRRAVNFYLKYDYKPAGIIEDYYYRGPAQFFLKLI
jgi:ribosomal protein S18 acetylase RimI-like enzyme